MGQLFEEMAFGTIILRNLSDRCLQDRHSVFLKKSDLKEYLLDGIYQTSSGSPKEL